LSEPLILDLPSGISVALGFLPVKTSISFTASPRALTRKSCLPFIYRGIVPHAVKATARRKPRRRCPWIHLLCRY